MMKQKLILVIALLALVSIMIVPVMAETLTGELGGDYTFSTNYNLPVSAGYTGGFTRLTINSSHLTSGISALIRFDNGEIPSYPSALASNMTDFICYNYPLGQGYEDVLKEIGRGRIGFQRNFDDNEPPIEIDGYQYLTFDSWNVSNATSGPYEQVYLVFDPAFELSASVVAVTSTYPPNGAMAFGSEEPTLSSGLYYQNIDNTVWAEYSVTKPGGLGIEGYVFKHATGEGILYLSRAYVFNATSGAVISSESTVTTDSFYVNVPAQTIKIGIQDSGLNWYNSSVLFSVAVPTVTPTPTTTIPAGYIVTYFRTFDPLGNSDIHGTDINLYDVEASAWTNYTADADGRGEIYTLPYHTVNAYGSYPTAGVYNDAELLGYETGYSGGHLGYLDMYPYTPAPAGGYTELYVTVRNRDDKSPITNAPIGITTISTGAYYVTNSGTSGTAVSIFPNNTALKILVTKDGYMSATVYANTGISDKKYVNVDMIRATVTPVPTATVAPGESTVRPTEDPNDPALHGGDTSLKAGEMMNWLAMHGMDLVQLCFLVTIFALLGVKLGK